MATRVGARRGDTAALALVRRISRWPRRLDPLPAPTPATNAAVGAAAAAAANNDDEQGRSDAHNDGSALPSAPASPSRRR